MTKAPTYNVTKELSSQENEDNFTTSAHWIIAIVRIAKKSNLSYSRSKKGSSSDILITDAIAEASNILIITGDCIDLNISGHKENHIKQLSAVLKQSEVNYLSEIAPGDWILSWIVNNETESKRIIDKIKNQEACNAFTDGFKFLGRVHNIRKLLSRDGAGGLTINYNLQAFGFKELDTKMFFEPELKQSANFQSASQIWFARIGLDVSKFWEENETTGVSLGASDNVHLLIPAFFEILLGIGFPQEATPKEMLESGLSFSKGSTVSRLDNNDSGQTESKAPPFAYMVPKTVGVLLGRTSKEDKSFHSYADLVDLLFGVQDYSDSTNSSDPNVLFNPKISENSPMKKSNHKYTGVPLKGAFPVVFPEFSNVPLWSVMTQFLNEPVNEIYTALKVNRAGFVVPTVVLRQKPFTTELFPQYEPETTEKTFNVPTLNDIKDDRQRNLTNRNITRFLSLPRWVLNSATAYSINIGKSDVTRFNFIHIYGQSQMIKDNRRFSEQLFLNPPISDDIDIARSGLHPYMTTVACGLGGQIDTRPGEWMELVADWTIGSQFTLNGSITIKGISAPICEGDNIQFEDGVYHIESVTHSCTQDTSSGNRHFYTTLEVTNGMRIDPKSDQSIYLGFDDNDATGSNPGLTSEGDNVIFIPQNNKKV